MGEGVRVIIASDSEHERVFASIYFGDKFVASVSQEAGPGSEMVELPGLNLVESRVLRKVPLAEFSNALARALQRLDGD